MAKSHQMDNQNRRDCGHAVPKENLYNTPLNCTLNEAALTLWGSLQKPGKGRCMACLERKESSPLWEVHIYEPMDTTRYPFAYAICPDCANDKLKIQAARCRIEIMSANMSCTSCSGVANEYKN